MDLSGGGFPTACPCRVEVADLTFVLAAILRTDLHWKFTLVKRVKRESGCAEGVTLGARKRRRQKKGGRGAFFTARFLVGKKITIIN